MVLSTREDLILTLADKNGATVICGIDQYPEEAKCSKKFRRELPTDLFDDHQIIINSWKDIVGKKSNRQRKIRESKTHRRKICSLFSASQSTLGSPCGLPVNVLGCGIVLRGAYDKFPGFFRMGTFIDSTHMKLLSSSK